MRSADKIRFAGDVNIEKIQIVSSTGFFQDITNQVIGIQVFEDLFSPFITGSLIIKDSLDLATTFPLVGEEFVDIKISTPTLKTPIEGRFYLFKMANKEILGDRSVTYELHFISQHAVIDLNKKVSKAWSGKCSDIVKEIMSSKEFGLQIDSKMQFVEETRNEIKFISNFWNPVKSLNYVCDHSLNFNESPTYVFFQNRQGYNFVSLETLYTNNDIVQEFYYDNYKRDELPGGGSVINPEQQYKRIKEIRIPESYDYLDNIRKGMFASRQYAYDITTKLVTVNNHDIRDSYNEGAHLNPYPIFSKNAIYKYSSMILAKPTYYGSFTDKKDVTNATFIQKRISLMRSADSSKIEITVPGRSDYTVGQKCLLAIDKMQPIKKTEDDTLDTNVSGAYIIGAVNHYIDRERHECIIELFKDSTLKNLDGK
jgi:hypothetical protein